MIDMPGLLTALLRSNTSLMSLAQNRIYCDEMPEGTAAPYVLVRAMSATPAAPPTLRYDSFAIQADVAAPLGQYAPCRALADAVRNALHACRGTYPTGVVTSVQVTTSMIGVDQPGSPALPRWVLTVDVTGRGN